MKNYTEEVLSKYFISNCLFEAVKAKIHNKGVKIFRRKPQGAIIHHYLWTCCEDGWIYDFGTNHAIFSPFIFRGYLRRRKISNMREKK